MKIYSYHHRGIISVTKEQFEFISLMIDAAGDIDKALGLYEKKFGLLSDGYKQSWRDDENFWPAVEAYSEMLARSRTLDANYLKNYMMATMDGKYEPTKGQLAVMNAALRILGIGTPSKSTRIEANPEGITVEINEQIVGEAKPTSDEANAEDKPAEHG